LGSSSQWWIIDDNYSTEMHMAVFENRYSFTPEIDG
jgi:hypothetical protein